MINTNLKVFLTMILGLTGISLVGQNLDEPFKIFDTQPDISYQKLKEGFYDVPKEAKMRTWWFWMNGIATKKSISQDLEAMKENGIAGAILIDNGGDYAPIGPTFMSDEKRPKGWGLK